MSAVGSLVAATPLDPSSGEARSWLRRELLHPAVHSGWPGSGTANGAPSQRSTSW